MTKKPDKPYYTIEDMENRLKQHITDTEMRTSAHIQSEYRDLLRAFAPELKHVSRTQKFFGACLLVLAAVVVANVFLI